MSKFGDTTLIFRVLIGDQGLTLQYIKNAHLSVKKNKQAWVMAWISLPPPHPPPFMCWCIDKLVSLPPAPTHLLALFFHAKVQGYYTWVLKINFFLILRRLVFFRIHHVLYDEFKIGLYLQWMNFLTLFVKFMLSKYTVGLQNQFSKVFKWFYKTCATS